MTYVINTNSSPETILFYTTAQNVYPASWYFQGGVLHFDHNSPNITLNDPTGLCAISVDAWTLPVGDYDISLKWKVTYSSAPTSQSYAISNYAISPIKYTGNGTVTSLSAGNFKSFRAGENTNSLIIEGSFLCRIKNSNASIRFNPHPFTSSNGGGSNISSINEYKVIAKRYDLNTF